jgi:hypothetical protein
VFGRGRGRTEKEKDRVSVVAELLPADLIPAELNLVGIDGNAGSIIGEVARALKKAGNSRATIDAVRLEMMAGDYDHLLVVALSVTTPSDE